MIARRPLGATAVTAALILTAPPAQAAVDPSLAIAEAGRVDAAGAAVITLSYACPAGSGFTSLLVYVDQRVGRFTVSGFGSAGPVCTGELQTTTATTFRADGRFSGGSAQVQASLMYCDDLFSNCEFVTDERTVRLNRGR